MLKRLKIYYVFISLPFVMLLMDYWPLNRLSWKCIKEKAVLFVIAGVLLYAVMGVLFVWAYVVLRNVKPDQPGT